jgi:hypothetical protein
MRCFAEFAVAQFFRRSDAQGIFRNRQIVRTDIATIGTVAAATRKGKNDVGMETSR